MQYMQPEPLDVNVAGENMLTIRVNCSVETVDASSRWLAAQEYVNQVNPAVVAFPSNSDAVPVARGRGEALQEPIRTEYPSLDGEGEVVVASDTGVDRKSCTAQAHSNLFVSLLRFWNKLPAQVHCEVLMHLIVPVQASFLRSMENPKLLHISMR